MNLQLGPLMPSSQPSTSIYFLAVIIVVCFAIGLLVLAAKRQRLRKPLAMVSIIVVAVSLGTYLFWSNEPSMDYWLMTELTYPAGDNHLDVSCENIGHLTGVIDLKLQFTNAQFINTTSESFHQLNSKTAKFTFTIPPGEKQSTIVFFNVNGSVTDFYIDLSVEDSGISFQKVDDGVSHISYQRNTEKGTFNQRIMTAVP